jgi:hypothetical protein
MPQLRSERAKVKIGAGAVRKEEFMRYVVTAML